MIHQLILIGPHGSGKTTLGVRLASALGWDFDDEIGRRLREEALRADQRAHAMRPQEDFDLAVMSEELARDQRASRPRVVETWHPGNLAYAQGRSPGVAARYREALRSLAPWPGAVVQPLRMTPQTGRSRLSEPGPEPEQLVGFFLQVGAQAEAIAAGLGLRVLPPLPTDDASPAELTTAILHAMQVEFRKPGSYIYL